MKEAPGESQNAPPWFGLLLFVRRRDRLPLCRFRSRTFRTSWSSACESLLFPFFVHPLDGESRANPSVQEDRIERLGDMIHCSHLDTPHNTLHVLACRDNHHRDITQKVIVLHLLEDLKAVHLRHDKVKEYDISRLFPQHFQGCFAAISFHSDVACLLQTRAQKHTRQPLIIHDQDCFHVVHFQFLLNRIIHENGICPVLRRGAPRVRPWINGIFLKSGQTQGSAP